MAAKTQAKSTGQYTTKVRCKHCSTEQYASNRWNQYFNGWDCVSCGKKN